MALISILIGILVERYLGSLQDLRSFTWLARFADWCRGHARDGLLGFVSVIGGILLGLLLLFWLLPGWLDFIVGTLMLLYALGPRDIAEQTRGFLDAMARQDSDGAAWHATAIAGGRDFPAEPQQLCRYVTETVLIEQNDRMLAVLFWFMVLGPIGALLYRVASQLRGIDAEGEFSQLARQFHYILAWVPARLTALSYALSGSLNDALHNWRRFEAEWRDQWTDRNDAILACVGWGALFMSPTDTSPDCRNEVTQALDLARRALIIWVSVIAVMTIAGLGG